MKKEISEDSLTTNISNVGKCSRCETNNAESEHICPYEKEVHNDNVILCNCCSSCENYCSDEI